MNTAKTWNVHIVLGEHDDGSTYAEARLVPHHEVTLIGVGEARLNPRDRNVPEIGDELAAARALSDLAHRLLDAAAEDISGVAQGFRKPGS
ncbi:MAG TPA: DUF1876 domain-containing protein [Nocardioidaceae bacterium]|jgi:hypothetical protein